MRNHIRRAAVILLIGILLSLPFSAFASTESPDDAYYYDSKQNSLPSVNGYLVQKTVSGKDKEAPFQIPLDLFADEEQKLYVLDSADGHLTVFDKELNLEGQIVFEKDNAPMEIADASGLFIKGIGNSKIFYVCDPKNLRVLIFDAAGAYIDEITLENTGVLPAGVEFRPTKVLVDTDGVTYILIPNLYLGTMVFSPEREFLGFLGGNKVEITLKMLLDYSWKQILNRVQQEVMSRYVPVDISNFDIDPSNFVYTVTNKTVAGGTIKSTGEIKKINAKSQNILSDDINFGDLQDSWHGSAYMDTSFVDITAMDNGYFAGLDSTRGRTFIYDPDGTLLISFGAMGNVDGSFQTPVAIESMGRSIYVLDRDKQTLSLFKPTAYGETVLTASKLFIDGDYDKSIELWRQVQKQSGGMELAHVGIGKALMADNQYEEAMKHFKLGQNRTEYSGAFSEHRKQLAVKYFPVIFIIVIALLGWMVYSDSKARKRRREGDVVPFTKRNIVGKALYTVAHPSDGFHGMTRQMPLKMPLILVGSILVSWFFISILSWQYTGFIFNPNSVDDFSIATQLLKTFVIFLMFCIANWAVTAMMEGSGRFTDIVIVSGGSLLPYLLYQAINIVFSNLITQQEGVFMGIVGAVLTTWALLMLFSGMKRIQELSTGQTLLSLFYTIIAMLIMAFLALLLYSLFQQVLGFFSVVFNEISVIISEMS